MTPTCHSCSCLQAELAAAQAQRDQAAQLHKEAEQELGALGERLAQAEASLGESRQEAQKAVQQQQEAAASAAELLQQLGEAQRQLAAGAEEKRERGQQQEAMQQQLAALQKKQSVADGKLVLARQREAQFKVRRCGLACIGCQALMSKLLRAYAHQFSPHLCAGGLKAAQGAAAGAADVCERCPGTPAAA